MPENIYFRYTGKTICIILNMYYIDGIIPISTILQVLNWSTSLAQLDHSYITLISQVFWLIMTQFSLALKFLLWFTTLLVYGENVSKQNKTIWGEQLTFSR